MPQDISFATELLEATAINEEKGIYGVTLIREGLTTDKRRYYPRKTLEAALPLFEGLQAYADHPTKTEMRDRPERSIKDLVGIYKNPEMKESSLYAELHTLDNAKWVRPILRMACEYPSLCGLSIHGDGQITPKAKDGADIVESIDAMFSTDVVTKPNAGGEITRLIASDRGGDTSMEYKDITLETLRENRPELVEELETDIRKDERDKVTAEFKEAADKKEAGGGDGEGMVKKEDYDELAKTVESMKVEKAITDSRILEAISSKEDKDKVKAELTKSLTGKSDEERAEVIEARKVLLKSGGTAIDGTPAKENQDGNHYEVGSILAEARNI